MNERPGTDHEMLKQLQKMSDAMQNTRSLEWNPFSFKLTEEKPDGPPAAGYLVWLKKSSENVGTNQRSDASGIADFGLVSPGNYLFWITKNWEGSHYALTSTRLVISPGSQTVKQLICPKADRVAVRIAFQLPDDMKKERLVVAASFCHEGLEMKDGSRWQLLDFEIGAAKMTSDQQARDISPRIDPGR